MLVLFLFLLCFLCPSLALAHPGHAGHDVGPMGPGSAVVLVGVTLGLAAHAWASWGPRRLVASVEGQGSIGGDSPEPEQESELKPYYTVRIPYVAHGRTEWHPTTDTGPFSQLTRGAHSTLEGAREWADKHLGGNSYTVARVQFDAATGEDIVMTVYAFEGVSK